MNTLHTFVLVLFCGGTSLALATVIDLFLPGPVERARQKLETASLRCFWTGVVNLVFWFVIVVLWFLWTQYKGGPEIMPYVIGTFLVLLLLVAVILPGLPGLVAIFRLLGERMGGPAYPLVCDLRGGLLLLLACLTPYVGWFVFTPALLCTAIGAGLLTFFQRKDQPPTVDEVLA